MTRKKLIETSTPWIAPQLSPYLGVDGEDLAARDADREVADLVRVAVAEAGVEGRAVGGEQRADLVQARDLELVRGAPDHCKESRVFL